MLPNTFGNFLFNPINVVSGTLRFFQQYEKIQLKTSGRTPENFL